MFLKFMILLLSFECHHCCNSRQLNEIKLFLLLLLLYSTVSGKVYMYLEYCSLLFQMMITLRKVSPQFIQEDTSMHLALSFRKCECVLNISQLNMKVKPFTKRLQTCRLFFLMSFMRD